MSCKGCTKIVKFQSHIDIFHWDMQCNFFFFFFFFLIRTFFKTISRIMESLI
ncbi:hypothetical protein C0J52_14883 [Blattella germanica]|nr:hypothetical protein C0J52_14883 [Blattella germanica]